MQYPTESAPSISARISATEPLSDRQMVRAVWTAMLLGLLMPPFTGVILMGVADFYPMPGVFLIFGSYTGPYVLACLVAGGWYARRFSAYLLHLGHLPEEELRPRAGRLLSRLPWYFAGGVLLYSIFGALSADFSVEAMGYRSYDLRGHLYNQFGLVPVVLVTVLPIFFYFTDQLGRYFGPRGLNTVIVPMGVKLAVLGLVTPLLIDSFLIGYYINHTGLFGFKTLTVWVGLLALAAGSTWLAWKSFRQGLAPLQGVLRGQLEALDDAAIAGIKPHSIDEFGTLTRHMTHQLLQQRNLMTDLQQTQSLFQAVLENANALILLLDQEGKLVLFNKACEELSGYSRDEVLGKAPWDIVLPEGERAMVRALAFEALANNPQKLQGRYTNHWQTKAGALRLIDWSNSVLLDDGGRMRFVISFGVDVTESRAVAEALERSEETYARAEEITHIGSWDWDIVTGGLRWSDEIYRIFGQTPRSFGATYEAFLSYIHPDDRQKVGDAVGGAVADPAQTYSVQHRVARPDGVIRLVHERGTVYRDKDDKPLRMIGTVHDITEQHAMEERLRAALQEKDLLLKEVYHRVKNNLQVVSSLLVLQGGNSDDPKLRGMLEDSANRIKSMALVHEQLYQSGDLVRIDFATYASQLIAHLTETHSGVPGITLRKQIEDVQVGLETAVPMGLIINELVSNAYKHAFAGQTGGEILLRITRTGDGELELVISDTGRGWPVGFDPKRTRSLGVRLVRSLCEQLGASYGFESGPGGGASFVMHFVPEFREDARLTV